MQHAKSYIMFWRSLSMRYVHAIN